IFIITIDKNRSSMLRWNRRKNLKKKEREREKEREKKVRKRERERERREGERERTGVFQSTWRCSSKSERKLAKKSIFCCISRREHLWRERERERERESEREKK